ncbi:nucleotidyltransferase domain-containing protein [Natranaeroarchaeum aerophilus]|uniref:Nucleotidyltransferase domain-containing protein n=1 Tax=Natranaeroarchaeum aerophilus TaxID=2917711 RepID=A0AAE3FR00_9EURY|nr:nucleotidyltransferase domain-containing protein [Natranaeroarchaeum aerophilus]MCL9813273.1 nucleotidyltransferase domain-containing protein [Natranaeroarchaeum aerophilus]
MDGGNVDSELIAAFEASVCADADVEFAIVFGSQSAGETTQASDIDLAVKFSDGLTEGDRFDKRCFLSGNLQREELPFIDVSDIEALSLDVAHDAVNGTFVCGDEDAFEQFKSDIEEAFSANRDTIRREQRAVIDRIAEDGLRG